MGAGLPEEGLPEDRGVAAAAAMAEEVAGTVAMGEALAARAVVVTGAAVEVTGVAVKAMGAAGEVLGAAGATETPPGTTGKARLCLGFQKGIWDESEGCSAVVSVNACELTK